MGNHEVSEDRRGRMPPLGLFTVDAEGGVALSISYLGKESMEPPVRLLWGERSGNPGSVRLKREK